MGRGHAEEAGELAGCQVRLTVLAKPSSPATLDRALAHLIEDAERLAESRTAGPSLRDPEDWPEGLAEKYRRQGFGS